MDRRVTALVTLACSMGQADTTFLASFESGYDAAFAKGNGKARIALGVEPGDIKLVPGRFGQGVLLKRKIPALTLSYETKANFSVRQGTLEFWFRPEWDSSFREPNGPAHLKGRTRVPLFSTSGSPTGFRLDKNQYNVLMFFYALSYDSSRSRVWRLGNFWQKQQWDHYAASWDGDEARLFLNGKLLAVSERWDVAGAIGGRMTLGSLPYGAQRHDGAWGTFDDFRISDTKLYVSSFALPMEPSRVQSVARPSVAEGEKQNGDLLRIGFRDGVMAAYALGSTRPTANRPLEIESIDGVKAVRLHRQDGGVGDTLCYEAERNLDPFLCTMEIAVRFHDGAARPANLLDVTEIIRSRRRPLLTNLRTGMRLMLSKDSRLVWQNLEAGEVIDSVESNQVQLTESPWHRLGVSWRGSAVRLHQDGECVGHKSGLALPSALPRYIFVGSNSQGEHTLDGWIKHVRITRK